MPACALIIQKRYEFKKKQAHICGYILIVEIVDNHDDDDDSCIFK